VKYLREERLWGNDDPLFPMIKVALGPSGHFEVVGLDRKNWNSATAIRKIFREAFESADLPYFNPHSFRNTLVRLGQTSCQYAEQLKAWSQNLGHEKVLTTLYSYGHVENQRQGEIIKGLAKPQPKVPADVTQLAKAIAQEMRLSENQR
jgi:integrase